MDIYQTIKEKYHETYEPTGWVIGKNVIDAVSQHYADNNWASTWKQIDGELYVAKIMGLPYLIDTENPNRIEIIR